MKGYEGAERRKHKRIHVNFVVSYRVKQLSDNYDLSQTKNVSQGGMLLTTNRKFDKDTCLAMTVRFPFIRQKIEVTGRVVSSKEVVKNLIYETRLQFLDLDEDFFQELGKFVKEYMKRRKNDS
ncbi:MAG: PilZ domain-containing protein [Candidatus Omnitrophota bacterium]|nr:MAG: PilZ domain-containing protein [Candidatus Omnitrophota bacterium]